MKFKRTPLSCAIITAIFISPEVYSSCSITNIASGVNVTGTYRLTASGSCDLADASYLITDFSTGAGSGPGDTQQLDGWNYGHIQNGYINSESQNLTGYGNYLTGIVSRAAAPGNPMTIPANSYTGYAANYLADAFTEQYQIFYTERPASSAISVSSNSTLTSTLAGGNLFIESNTTNSNGLVVARTGEVDIAGNLITKITAGSASGVTYGIRSIYNEGSMSIGKNLISFGYNHPNATRPMATSTVQNLGTLSVAENAYIYTGSGARGFVNEGTFTAQGDLDSVLVRRRNTGSGDLNWYLSSAIVNQGSLSAKNINILAQGFIGIQHNGANSTLKTESLILDNTQRDANDPDTWMSTSNGIELTGGKGLIDQSTVKALGSAVYINGSAVAFSLGDSSFDDFSDLNNATGSAFLNLGAQSSLESTTTSAVSIAEAIDSNIVIKAGAALKSAVGQSLISDLGGQSTISLMQGAALTGDISQGAGNDTFNLYGSLVGSVYMGDDDDTFNIAGGSLNGTVSMEAGNDTVNFNSGSLSNIAIIDAGTGTADTLNLNANASGATTYATGDPVSAQLLNFNNINILNNSTFTLTGDSLVADNVFISAGAELALDPAKRAATIDGNLINSGLLNLDVKDFDVGQILTVTGNYEGRGGRIELDTEWYEAGTRAVNSVSDELIILGNATGRTQVSVKNTILGGVKLTTHPQISVPEIEVRGTVDKDAFWGYAETSNAGEAQLIYEGDGKFAWYLGFLPNQDVPKDEEIYAPDVPGYVLASAVNVELMRDVIGTYRDRKGGAYNAGFDFDNSASQGAWARVWHKDLKGHGQKRLDWHAKSSGYQVGYELENRETDDGTVRTDTYFSYVDAESKTYDKYSAESAVLLADKYAGKIKTESINLGLTRTYVGDDNTYTDIVGQVSSIHNRYEGRRGREAKNRGWGATASFEQGMEYALNDEFYLEPMYQIMVNYLSQKDFHDDARDVSQGKQWDGLFRTGGRFYYQKASEKTPEKDHLVYLKAHYVHDFNGKSRADIGESHVTEKGANQWIELGVGFQLQADTNTYFYLDAGFEKNLSSAYRKSHSVQMGLNHKW